MPATIKLVRTGKKNYAHYRIVVMDKRKKPNGAYIEKIGTYNPMTNPPEITLNKDKLHSWIQKGAVLTEGTRKLHLDKK
jgi:small subunit ribosomal protein S16